MVCGVAGPHVVTNDCTLAITVFLDGPDALWQISAHLIEEVRLKHCIVLQQ